MFVDFNKVFQNKPQTEITVPSAFVNYMNKSLPSGVKYMVEADGTCVIAGEGESYTIGGLVFSPTEEQKNILGKNFTHEDVIEYFYNTQKPIPLALKKEGYIILNGQEFPVEKLAYNPLNPVKYVSGSLFAYPHPFPKPFPVTVGCDKYSREIIVSRVPNDSVHVAAFESSKEEPLYIRYLVNQKTNDLTMNMSFNLKNAKTIRDIVESTLIYNAYLDGKGLLFGHYLNASINSNGANRFDDSSAAFWEKVLKIEEFLDVEFCPPKEDVDFETICMVEQLYQNLINKIPTRDKQIINSIDGNWDFESCGKDINESIGRPMFFEFEATSQIELFGVKKPLPILLGIFNAVLVEYSKKGKKQKLVLEDESSEKKRYTSVMHFKTEEDLRIFKTTDHDQVIKLFHDAKRPYEYL